MHFARPSGPLLQIPLSEQVIETLVRVQEAQIVTEVVTVCVVLGVTLFFLAKQSKLLTSFFGNLLQFRTQLNDVSAAPIADALDTQADRAKLLKAFKIKTEQRLMNVLSNDQLIAFSWADQPQEVGRMQREMSVPEASPQLESTFLTQLQSLNPMRLLQRPDQAPVALDPSDRMMDVFNRADVAGRLLILGEPGAGKTTTLLELARELIANAEANDKAPVPIIFELSNWTNDQQPIEQWLVAQLKEEYNIPLKVGQHWITTHQILPLLDGLDELALVWQQKCAVTINEFLPIGEPERQAAVCCRTKEFRLGHVTLTGLNRAVELQPLSQEQIQDYLAAIGQPSLLNKVIQPSSELAELAQTPLMLTVMAVVLANRPAKTEAELFEAYIEERFICYEQGHGTLAYSRRNTRHYLEQLATQLKAQNQTTFLIETMQPVKWLQTWRQKLAYRLIFGLISGLIFGLIFGLFFGMISGLFFGLISGLIIGLAFGLVFGLIFKLDGIKRIETLEFSFSCFSRKRFFQEFLRWLIIGLIFGLISWLIFRLISWLIFGLVIGLIFGLIGGLKSVITIRTQFNQGILASAKNALFLTILGMILAGMLNVRLNAALPMIVIDPEQIESSVYYAMFILILLPLFVSGGLVWMQHFAMRLVLWRCGTIPWDYADFLKYTSDMRLTQQTGGEFRFFHDLLREHLAQSSP